MEAVTSASNLYALELASREVEGDKFFEQTPWLRPKHKIFISHSGSQKDFAEQLCEDLERDGYYPFFDKRDDSLPKGERFPELIFKAARECLLAIVLLSEEFFTRTKWPMLELAAFVQAGKPHILPVLLGLSIKDLKSAAKWSEHWMEWGKQDRRLTCDVIKEWEAAVQHLKPVNMFLKSSYDGEVALRKAIVCSIIQTMPSDVRSDVVHVQGRERLCKELRSNFDKVSSISRLCKNARVLGVYGDGGAGKSTLCVIMTQFVNSEFLGRVCHVEFGVGTSIVDLQRKVLRRLFKVTEDFLNMHISTEGEGLSRLRERMPQQPVFLALDNVSEDAISTANSFLRLTFCPGSMVLVTSRSDDILQSSLGIPESSCMCCPSITLEEARDVLLQQVNLPIECLDAEQKQVLHQTMERCSFNGYYHPLALKVFAAQLGTNPLTWRERKPLKSALEDSLLSAIESSYTQLPDQVVKEMFIDIALFTPEGLCTGHEISKWLNDAVYLDVPAHYIEKNLSILREKSLLEVWKNMDDETVRVHEFYRMLAERKATVVSKFIYQRGGALLENDQARIVKRAAFVEANFTLLELEECTKLQVLSLRRCGMLEKVCIQHLGCMVSLELAVCPLQSLDLSGLSSLRWLRVLDCKNLRELHASDSKGLGYVYVSKCSNLEELDLKNCDMVRSLSILYSDKLYRVIVGSGQKLECLTLWFCRALLHLEISGVSHLTALKKRGCPRLWNMQGGDIMCKGLEYMCLESWSKLSPPFIRALQISASLRVLDLWHCPIWRLPNLETCLYLQELRLSDVDVLLDSNKDDLHCEYDKILRIPSADLELPKSLEDIRIEGCRNVVVKEVFLKLKGLRNLRLLSLQEVRVGWDWELYRRLTDGIILGESFSLAVEKECTGLREMSEEFSYVEDEEVSMLRNQLDVFLGQGMKADEAKLSSEAKDLQMGGRSEMCIVEPFSLQHEESMGMKAGDVGVNSETNHSQKWNPSENCSGEVQDGIGVTSYLNGIMHWIQVSLSGKTKLEQSVETKIQLHWKTCAGPTILQHEQLQELFWSNMIEAFESTGSPCWVVEQIIRKTCSDCDALCVSLQEVLMTSDKVLKLCLKDFMGSNCELVWLCQKAHVQEIGRQLVFLTAKHSNNIVMKHGVWEEWERTIIEEVVFRKGSSRCENRFCGKSTLGILRLEKLSEHLMQVGFRGWEEDCRVQSDKQELVQFALDCRVWLSVNQLKRYLAKQDSGGKEARYRLDKYLQELQELSRDLDAMLNVEMKKLQEDALASCDFQAGYRNNDLFASWGLSGSDECDRFAGLIRCWKVHQWLRELESCLSEHLMQERKQVFKEGMLLVKEIGQSVSEIKKQLQLMESHDPTLFAHLTPIEIVMTNYKFGGGLTALRREAEQLMSQKWPDMDLLFDLLYAERAEKLRVKEDMDALCLKTDYFLKHMQDGLNWWTQTLGKKMLKEAVLDWMKNLWGLAIGLLVKQSQCLNLLLCISLDDADSRSSIIKERTNKVNKAIGRIAEVMIAIAGNGNGKSSLLHLIFLVEQLQCSTLEYSWKWIKTLLVKRKEELEFSNLRVHSGSSNMVQKRIHILDILLEEEFKLLRDRLALLKIGMKGHHGLFERASQIISGRLTSFMSVYSRPIWSLEFNFGDIRRDLREEWENSMTEECEMLEIFERHCRELSADKWQRLREMTREDMGKTTLSWWQRETTLSWLLVGTNPNVMPNIEEELMPNIDINIVKAEAMGGGKGSMEDMLQRARSFPLLKMWEDVNTKQVVELPFSQCTGLRHLRISNCRLKNPRAQLQVLTGPWKCWIADAIGKFQNYNEYSQVTLGVMHFHRLSPPAKE